MMMTGGFGIFGFLFMAGLLILLVWALARLFPDRREQATDQPQDAEETLRQRFARGEIEAEEYGRMLAVLKDDKVHEKTR